MYYLKKYQLELKVFVGVGILLWLFTLYDYGFFYTLKIYMMNANGEREHIHLLRVLLNPLLNKMSIDETVIWGTNFFQLCISFIASLVCFQFYKNHKNINQFKYYRGIKAKTSVMKELLKVCFSFSLAIYLAYLVYYFLIAATGTLEGPAHYPNGILPRTIFLDLFGESFYYTYSYWILEGAIRFFAVPMVYAFFSCVCSLVFDSPKVGYLVSNGYYIVLSALMGALSFVEVPLQLNLYLNPSVVMASGSYDLKTIPLLLGMLIPVYLGCILLWWRKADA